MLDIDRNFALNAYGDWTVLSGADAAQQRIESRLGTNQGEWAFDLAYGVPWLFQILGESGDSAAIRGLITRKIMEDPEVASISSFEAGTLGADRRLAYSVRVRLRLGGEVTLTV